MSGAIICLWAPAEHRLDAFAGALSALTYARAACRFRRDVLRIGRGARDCTVAEAITAARDLYGGGAAIEVALGATLGTRRMASVEVSLWDEAFSRVFDDYEPFHVDVLDSLSQGEGEDLLGRICASPHVLTCASSISRAWPAPAEASATCNGDGSVARDLALTWLHLRERTRVRDVAGLSLGVLRTRVEAAPPGTRVGVATSLATWFAHHEAGWGAEPTGRIWSPGDAGLTREHVLAVLDTSSATLIEALEASAVPNDEGWAAEEPEIEAVPARKQGTPAREADVTTDNDDDRIELHAPHHVRRLPNGGVMLAAHASRILWPLWADALSLLGIREAT
jgi:hypothetical protein